MPYLFLAFAGACIAKKEVNVALGSLAAAAALIVGVRFTPGSRHSLAAV